MQSLLYVTSPLALKVAPLVLLPVESGVQLEDSGFNSARLAQQRAVTLHSFAQLSVGLDVVALQDRFVHSIPL